MMKRSGKRGSIPSLWIKDYFGRIVEENTRAAI